MTSTRITELFARKLAGEATEEELKELEEYLQNHPEEQYFQEIVSNWWEAKNTDDTDTSDAQDAHFRQIINHAAANDPETQLPASIISISGKKFWKRTLVAASATVILLLSAWKFFGGSSKPAADGLVRDNEIIAHRGTKSKVLLPDGTQVWLNSDSRLVYTSAFNSDTIREVTLDGEAFFDVVKDPGRPFIVHTSAINIRVLGTAFNVKSYSQEPTIEATLVRGLIEVEKNNEPRSSRIMLRPNEKLVYNKIQDKISGTGADKEKQLVSPGVADLRKPQSISITAIPKNITDSNRIETSWVYGKLLFEGDTFSELARKMERWFNIRIVFENDKVMNYRFRGVFENENVDEALHALQLTASFKYSINGDEVVISKK
ncbi:MAG: DUF4974 domain-containing protein [Chitinophagaceae bacterium]|nr:DUF4974 domain-containing protein [Chitinophagaceae bacterium]